MRARKAIGKLNSERNSYENSQLEGNSLNGVKANGLGIEPTRGTPRPALQANSVVLKVLHSSFVRLRCTSSRECPKVLALPSLGALFAGIETILPVLKFANHVRSNPSFVVAKLRLPFEYDWLLPQHRDAQQHLASLPQTALASTKLASRPRSALSSSRLD